MTAIPLVGTVLWLAVVHSGSAFERVVWQEATDKVLVQQVELGAGALTPEGLRAMGARLVSSNNSRPFIYLAAYVTPSEQCTLLPKGNHWTYSIWDAAFRNCERGHWEIGDFFFWRGRSAIRLRRSDGTVQREIVAGPDPMRKEDLEILMFAFPRPPESGHRIEVFALSHSRNPLDLEAGYRSYDFLVRDLPFQEVSLYLRNDSWFILQARFPVMWPFESNVAKPLSESEYRKSVTVWCSALNEQRNCKLVRP